MKKLTFSLSMLVILSLIPFNGAVQACPTPMITILGVTEDTCVTVEAYNFPASKTFEVTMGLYGTKGIDGILIGTVDSDSGGSLALTFSIPDTLIDEEKIAIRLESTSSGHYAYNWFTNTTFGTHDSDLTTGEVVDTPVVAVVSVKEDTLVIIKGTDFPVDEDIDVLMGEYGTAGIDGTSIGTINSGEDGDFIETFSIPDGLKSESKIAIRFELTSSDTAAYTWFENETGASGGSDEEEDDDEEEVCCTYSYTGTPTISVLSVEEGEDVTIKAYNFPTNRDLQVLMGKMWTQAIGGTQVTTINSGDDGSFTASFTIPDSLTDDYRVAIRLQTSDGYFYAYNWFYNNTTGDDTDSASACCGYTGIPTFSISSVSEDDTVTITTNNFPSNLDFQVLMGKMWTQGINGVYITTIDSDSGGAFSMTFTIPSSLAGEDRIAIRLEDTSCGFYAYNWFYNTTAP